MRARLSRGEARLFFLHKPQLRDFDGPRRGWQEAQLPQHIDHRALYALPGPQVFNRAVEPLAVLAGQRRLGL
jgi:hypothetical protein